MHISMKHFDGSRVLAGALNGRKVFGKLLEKIAKEPEKPESVFLDFDGVQVATASFLRECVLEFRDSVRRRRSNFYPVVANINESISEELSILLAPQRDALLVCSLNCAGEPSSPRIIGALDPKQQVTFELLKKLGETDASEIMRRATESERIGQTAWNNRLASLARLGIAIEVSNGRTKRYRPLLEES